MLFERCHVTAQQLSCKQQQRHSVKHFAEAIVRAPQQSGHVVVGSPERRLQPGLPGPDHLHWHHKDRQPQEIIPDSTSNQSNSNLHRCIQRHCQHHQSKLHEQNQELHNLYVDVWKPYLQFTIQFTYCNILVLGPYLQLNLPLGDQQQHLCCVATAGRVTGYFQSSGCENSRHLGNA